MFVITPDFVFKQVLYVRFYTYFSVKVVISRLLVQDILSVESPYARIRLRGMFVIALRGYLREFRPKVIHFWLFFLSHNSRTDSVLSPSLSWSSALSSSPSIQSSQLGERSCCMIEVLVEQVDSKPRLIQVSSFPSFRVWIQTCMLCVCVCFLASAGEFLASIHPWVNVLNNMR